MRTLREWLSRLLGSLSTGRDDEELREELRTHLELARDELRRNGASPSESARRARLRAGGVDQAMESLRHQRGVPWIADLRSDVRQGCRTLRRSPGFTLVALLTLGLGIGATTAIFAIVNGLLLRPLAYPAAHQLVHMSTQFPALRIPRAPVSAAEYLELREGSRSFSAVGAYTTGEVNLVAGGQARRARSASVDASLLRSLRVAVSDGRLFATGETDRSPAAPIVMLSYSLWQSAYGGRPIVGTFVDVNGVPREVVGIVTPGLDVMDDKTEVWLPLGLDPATRGARDDSHNLWLIGRLKDGVSLANAQREMAVLLHTWAQDFGAAGHLFSVGAVEGSVDHGHVLLMASLHDEIVGSARQSIWVLQAAVAVVLLVACANLANLLLARAETRRRDFAVRTALGAGRMRVLRQLLTEGLLLSFIGGALGLAFARLALATLLIAFPTALPRSNEIAFSAPVLLFAFGVSMVVGLLCESTSLMHTRLRSLVSALREGGTRGSTVGARRGVRRSLVMAEIALAVMLVVAAGLLVRTASNLTHVDVGFSRDRLITFSMTLPQAAYPSPLARAQRYEQVLDGLRALPGVEAVTAMSGLPPHLPLAGAATDLDDFIPSRQAPAEVVDYYQHVMAGYFETMGIAIREGRSFQSEDASSSGLVAVVNETFVRKFWPGGSALGQRLRPCCGSEMPWFTVVGVAADVKQGGVDREAGTELYLLVEQVARLPPPVRRAPTTMNVVLRTILPSASLAPTVRQILHDVDSTVPVVRLRHMNAVFDESVRRPRLLAHLIGAFAGLALLLAAIGTYGVLAYMVEERRREIGIRMALGASRGRVMTLVVTQGLALTALGVLVGVAGALSLNHLLGSVLFGVTPTDPVTVVAVAGTVVTTSVVACTAPAWRASRLDPYAVLRAD